MGTIKDRQRYWSISQRIGRFGPWDWAGEFLGTEAEAGEEIARHFHSLHHDAHCGHVSKESGERGATRLTLEGVIGTDRAASVEMRHGKWPPR